MNTRHFAIVITAFIGTASICSAHPGDEHADHVSPSRTWTDAKLGQSFQGHYLASREGLVSIEEENGEVVMLHVADLTESDQREVLLRHQAAAQRNGDAPYVAPATRPAAAVPFSFFPKHVTTHWDHDFLYVESDGMPDHHMMIGIRAWQQQVPLPQRYTGDNAWRIPLVPVPAKDPISAKDNFFRGAIALAANGVPIFNPIKNDGKTDTFLAGELDEFGGHSGRADDYHYHIAPLHLQKIVGENQPLAYALDGYPIYGLFDGKPCPITGDQKLDAFNGHADANGAAYHYHASKAYPYLNGGMHGEVTVREGQIDPQPRATPLREATKPLRGAKVIAFAHPADNSWKLEYTIGTDRYVLDYQIAPGGDATFTLTGPDGKAETSTYKSRREPPRAAPREPRRDALDGNDGKPRRPWILVHAAEMDTDKNGELSIIELRAEIDSTFKAYDHNADNLVSRDETSRPVRSPLGGFVQQHFDEFAKGESFNNADAHRALERMFKKQDTDHDDTLSATELAGDAK